MKKNKVNTHKKNWSLINHTTMKVVGGEHIFGGEMGGGMHQISLNPVESAFSIINSLILLKDFTKIHHPHNYYLSVQVHKTLNCQNRRVLSVSECDRLETKE